MTTTTTSEMPLTTKLLKELTPGFKAADERVRELEIAGRQSLRGSAKIEAAIVDLAERAELAGEDPDPEELAKLREQLRESESAIALRPTPQGGVEFVNVETGAKLRAARQVREERAQALQQFLDANRVEIAAEHLEADQALAAEWLARLRAFVAIDVQLHDRTRFHINVLGVPATEMRRPPRVLDPQAVADVEQLVHRDQNAIVPVPTWLLQ